MRGAAAKFSINRIFRRRPSVRACARVVAEGLMAERLRTAHDEDGDVY